MTWNAPLFKQIWVACTIGFIIIGHGMVAGITSSMLPALEAPDSPIKLNLEQQSWLASSTGLGSIVMYLLSIFLLSTFGRKGAVRIGLIPGIIGHLICYFFYNVNALIFGRFLCGLGFGSGFMGAVVIGEYMSPQYRGVFLCFKNAALNFGFTIVHILGNYLHWRTVKLTVTFVYVLGLFMTYFWPESPSWLVSKKKYKECADSFYSLRGKSEQSTQELVAMIGAQKEKPNIEDISLRMKILMFLKKFTQMNLLKPLGIYFFAAMLQEVAGRYVFPAYALKIIYQIEPNPANAFYYTLGIDLLMSVCALIATILVKIMNRRTLLFYSGISAVVVRLVACLFNYLQNIQLISQSYGVICLYLLGLNFGIVHAGCIPICLNLVGEIFPLEHRPTGVSLSGVFISIFMSITLKVTPFMLDTIKIYGTFGVYGLLMIVCLIVLYYTLPETKDKTLQEIEYYFNKKLKKDKENDPQTSFNLINRARNDSNTT